MTIRKLSRRPRAAVGVLAGLLTAFVLPLSGCSGGIQIQVVSTPEPLDLSAGFDGPVQPEVAEPQREQRQREEREREQRQREQAGRSQASPTEPARTSENSGNTTAAGIAV